MSSKTRHNSLRQGYRGGPIPSGSIWGNAIPPFRTMGNTLTKSQIDRLKKLSQQFAAIAKEGKETPSTSATLAEHTEHHSEAAKVAPNKRSGKAGQSKVGTERC